MSPVTSMIARTNSEAIVAPADANSFLYATIPFIKELTRFSATSISLGADCATSVTI